MSEHPRRTVAIVQARYASTRLPGKVLLTIGGVPILRHVVDRAREARLVDLVVVATGPPASNGPILDYCARECIPGYVGPEDDVLNRFVGAASAFGAQDVVRLTADCPLHSGKIIDHLIAARREYGYDYLTNAWPGGETYPDGLDCEVFTFRALKLADAKARSASDREHVTPWLRRCLPQGKKGATSQGPDLSAYRLTVDESADLEALRAINRVCEVRKVPFTWRNAIDVLDACPEIAALNQRIGRNEGYAKSLEREKKEQTTP